MELRIGVSQMSLTPDTSDQIVERIDRVSSGHSGGIPRDSKSRPAGLIEETFTRTL